MEPKKESLTNLENQMEKIYLRKPMKISKILKKTIADTNGQLKKTNENLNQLWTTVNKTLQLTGENQQKLKSIESSIVIERARTLF